MISKIMPKTGEKNSIHEFSYQEALVRVKKKVNEVLSASPAIIREYTVYLSRTTGKFIRAKSLLACAQNDTNRVPQDAVILATAIEILHLATLIHDDVIDDADLRRGAVTLQKRYGSRTAVICGDYLLSVAFSMVALVSEKEKYLERKIPNFVSRLCLGELNQHINNGNYDLSVFKYLKIIAGKTACLFETAFYAGASLVEENESNVKQYAKIGRYIGMVFQLTDDCMDFETTKHIAQKTVQSDYEQNVITLPLIHALKKVEGFKDKAKKQRLPRSEINAMVQRAGGLYYARKLARRYQQKAMEALHQLEIPVDKKEKIMVIAHKAYRVF